MADGQPGSDEPVRRGRAAPTILAESGRVEAFSDGVLAIAITLLVLDLKAPEGPVAHGLLEQWPAYLAYLSSFLYIGVVWVNHHALFTRIAAVDGGLLWRNMFLLLMASVLPFPTSTLASAMDHGTHADQFAAVVLYAGVQVGMAVTWLIVFTYLMTRPYLLAAGTSPEFFRDERRRSIIGIALPLLGVAVAVVAPLGALLTYVAVPLFYAATAQGMRQRPTG